LTAFKMSLADLEKRLQQSQCTTGVLCDIAALADQALQETRTTSYLLHPPLLDEAGFTAAAQWYAEGFAKRSGIEARLDFGPELQRLPPHIETALFRVLQESLTNVHRYSGSPQVKIRLQRQAGTVTLEIEDFGRGIPGDLLTRLRQASAETGVGLAGMRERMNDLKGMLEIESNTHGTIIRAVVPLPQSLDLLGANCETGFFVRTRQRVAGHFEKKRSALGVENARRCQPIHRLTITWDMAVNRLRVWRRAPLVAAGVT
jgi:signal transduction histidine kinase